MNTMLRTLLILTILFSRLSIKAEGELNIRSYTSLNGLSQNTVRCIMQDSTGFIWIGTTNGFNRYDGHNFEIIRPKSVSNFRDNRINGFSLDNKGRIWVNTSSNTYYLYSPDLESFIDIPAALSKAHADSVKAATKQRSRKARKQVFGNNPPPNTGLIQDNAEFSLFGDRRNNYVWIYDKLTKRLHSVEVLYEPLPGSVRYRAARTEGGIFWITTLHDGLVRFDANTGTTRRYTMRDGLSSNNLRCIMRDRSGDLWVGTNERGVMQVRLPKNSDNRKLFNYYDSDGNTMEIRMAFVDSRGRGWFGAHNANSNIYINDNGTTHTLTLPGGNAYCGLELPDGRKLIGTKSHGIYVIDRDATKVLGNISSPDASRPANNVYGMTLDAKGRLWVATHGDGVHLYLPSADTFRFGKAFRFGSENSNHLRGIISDRTGRMWMASNNGLISFVPDALLADSKSYKRYGIHGGTPGGDNFTEVRCIHIDRSQTLWIGTTGDGLFYADLSKAGATPAFKRLDSAPFNQNEIIQSVCTDRKGRVWVTSENFVAYIRDNYRSEPAGSVVSLPLDEELTFSESSLCADRSHLYIGCNDGVLVVDLSQHDGRASTLPVIFTGLEVNGRHVTPGAEGSPLTANINRTEELRLEYWQNRLKIDCSTLNFRKSPNSGYYYCLQPDGSDEQVWIATNSNSLIFNELQPGSYTLRVKSYDGSLSAGERQLRITVLPPWWHTWWAYCIYIVAVVVIVWILAVQWMNRQRERAKASAERSLAEYKINFFSRVSHDLRTPLTVIQGSLEALPQNEGHTTYQLSTEKMGLLHRNADKLLMLVDKVLSFNASVDNDDELKQHIVRISGEADALLNNVGDQSAADQPELTDIEAGGYKILLVDDNDDVLQTLKAQLEPHFTVFMAYNGREALDLLPEVQPDLVVCDVMMPGMDGIEFTSRLRADTNISHIPVILLTASVGEETHLKGIQVGADAFLTKPFNRKLLFARITGLIEQRRKLQNRYATDPVASLPLIKVVDRDKLFAEHINRLFAENLSNPDFKLENHTAEFNVGRTTLFAKFKAVLGYTPSEYMRLQRMKKAAELLLTTEMNVSEICYRVGINDPFYFSRLFKQVYDKSPTQFRKDGWAAGEHE